VRICAGAISNGRPYRDRFQGGWAWKRDSACYQQSQASIRQAAATAPTQATSPAYATINNLTNETRTNSVAFAFNTGELWSVDTTVLQLANDKRIDFLSVARVLIQNLNRYGQFLQCLGIEAHFRWIAGLEGVRGWKLQAPNAVSETCLTDLIEVSGTYDVGKNPAETLRPFFNRMFQKCSMQLPAAIDHAIRTPRISETKIDCLSTGRLCCADDSTHQRCH
jgi:hypothetical protein